MTKSKESLRVHNKGRLSKSVIPLFYELTIEPNLSSFSFIGEETVSVEIKRAVSSIILNSAEIEITSAFLQHEDGTKLFGTVKHNEKTQKATIKFSGKAGKGKWSLVLSFKGILNNKLRGFYRSIFKDSQGNEKTIATTKFEPSDARRAFPCFDEPCFKAVFKVNLIIEQSLSAISNMKEISSTNLSNGKKLVSFAPSIPMSSYLVSYVVGDFSSSELVLAAKNTEIRIWSVPGKSHLHSYALNVAKFALEYFSSYFEIDYPSEKLDLIAIPDFASGAMEDFGCIKFRETALLLNENTATFSEFLRVAEVICHEIAHMWFGDLVTMEWWNGLWLNEAFATFMAAKALDAYKPEWKFWEIFNNEKAAALKVDGLHSTRSIEFPVTTPEDARAMFDILTYEKGCAILRMLELNIGEENFRKGCASYMKKHAYGNTETANLWEALGEVLDSTDAIKTMMDTWVYQPGYPIIRVSVSAVSGSVHIEQQQFNYLAQRRTSTKLWHIPITIKAKTKDGLIEKSLVLNKKTADIYIGEGFKTLIINANSSGFYRVSYDSILLNELLSNYTELSPSQRFNFISDLWASTQAGFNSLQEYLSCLEKISLEHKELDHNIWSVIIASLNMLARLVFALEQSTNKTNCKNNLLAFINKLMLPTLNSIGWQTQENETTQISQLRASLISSLGSFGNPEILKFCQDLYESYKKDTKSIDSNILPAVIETIAANNQETIYEEFCKLKAKATTPQEESRLLYALADFREESLIKRTLADTINGVIRIQDAPIILRKLFFNTRGSNLAWSFTITNWHTIVKLFPLQGIIRLIDGLSILLDATLDKEIDQFVEREMVPGSEKAVKQALESRSIALSMLEREKQRLQSLFLLEACKS